MNERRNFVMDSVDQRLFLLFCREKRPELISSFWADPDSFDISSKQESDPMRMECKDWLRTKRQIPLDELMEGTWELRDYYKRLYIVNFSPDNTFLERGIRDHSFCWGGKWEWNDGIPRMKFGSIELDIVANKDGDYSGVQIVDDYPHDYLKITHNSKRMPIPLSLNRTT